VKKRPDDFETRREHLGALTDEQLVERFWALADDIVRPLVELAEGHTSPSIERSVLLRMGFSSLEAKELVERISDRGLLGKGAGHVVLAVAQKTGLSTREAGLALINDDQWETVDQLFQPGRES